jgi:hypothetical protein
MPAGVGRATGKDGCSGDRLLRGNATEDSRSLVYPMTYRKQCLVLKWLSGGGRQAQVVEQSGKV